MPCCARSPVGAGSTGWFLRILQRSKLRYRTIVAHRDSVSTNPEASPMILATGANGMLGSYFPDESVLKTDIPEMDVTDFDCVRDIFRRHRPGHVLHLAAWTDVDGAESHIEDCYRTNAVGTLHVAAAAKEVGAILTYISTTQIFNGKKDDPYTEFDETDPVNAYGASKAEGERIVREICDRHYIFRAGWMLGGGGKDHKFVGKMFDLMKTRDELIAVDDKTGSPTYARDLCEGILAHIETGLFGTYHMVNGGGVCTRYAMATEIAKILGRDDITISPVSSECFPLPAKRGNNESAVNYKLSLMGRNPMRPWREALSDYVRNELMTCGR